MSDLTVRKMRSLKTSITKLSYEEQLRIHEEVQRSRLTRKETKKVRREKKSSKKKLLDLAKKAKTPEEIEEILSELKKKKENLEKGGYLDEFCI